MDSSPHHAYFPTQNIHQHSVFIPAGQFQPAPPLQRLQSTGSSRDAVERNGAMEPPPLKRSKTLTYASSTPMTATLSTPFMPMRSQATARRLSRPAATSKPLIENWSQSPIMEGIQMMSPALPYRPVPMSGLDGIPGTEVGQWLGIEDTRLPLNILPPSPSSIPRDIMLATDSLPYSSAVDDQTIPSSCGSLTEATTLDTAMGGNFSDGYPDNSSLPFEMAHADSQGSYLEQATQAGGVALAQDKSNPSIDFAFEPPYFGSDEAIRGIGSRYSPMTPSAPFHYSTAVTPEVLLPQHQATGMERSESANTFSSLGFPVTAEAQRRASEDFSEPQQFSVDMERSISSASARSNVSLKLRARNALHVQINNAAKNQLQPRLPATPPKVPADATPSQMKAPDSASDASSTEVGDASRGNKIEIPKAKRERQKTQKLFCKLCKKVPEGFRGEHELRRHHNREHETLCKKWICRDPREAGIETTLEVFQPLSDCRNCRDKKYYGAYYNAGAHLKRTHFTKKAPRKGNRTKSASGDDVPDAGDKGIDLPMAELKKWMVEVTVSAADLQTNSPADPDNDPDAAEQESDDDDDDDDFNEDPDAIASYGASNSLAVAGASTANNELSNNLTLDANSIFGMGYGFPTEAVVTAMTGSEPAAPVNIAGLHADMVRDRTRDRGLRPDVIQPVFASLGVPLSSANFLELQNIFPDLGELNHGTVSSPSGTTITQGTIHPHGSNGAGDLAVDATHFDFAQSFASNDSPDFEFL